MALSGIAGLALLLPFLPGIGSVPSVIVHLQPMGGAAGLVAGSYTGMPVRAWMIDASLAFFWALMAMAACRNLIGFALAVSD